MGAFYETIPESIIKWILSQHLFYVASAPLSPNGHINVSPKGGPYFGITSPSQFWQVCFPSKVVPLLERCGEEMYQELTGSGNETISHIHEPNNARICIMLNAYDGPPKIVRLWGRGRVLENGTTDFNQFVAARNREVEAGKEGSRKIELIPGTRSIIIVDVEQVGSSCGFSVPYYDFKGHRDILNNFMEKKDKKFREGETKESMDHYWAYKNAWSMDGLPGMKRGLVAADKYTVTPIKKMVGPLGEKLAYGGKMGGSKQFTLEQLLLAVLIAVVVGAVAAVQGPALLGQLQGLAGDGASSRPSVMAWSQREI